MSAADTGAHPLIEVAPLRPPPRRRHPDRRAQVVRQVLEVIGATRWGSPPPVSMRQALLRVLLTTIAVALLLGGR